MIEDVYGEAHTEQSGNDIRALSGRSYTFLLTATLQARKNDFHKGWELTLPFHLSLLW